MASKNPTTPTANRQRPTGSSTTIPQPDFSATAPYSAIDWAAVTSTPSAKGIVSNQTASTRKQMDPYLNEDLSSSRVYLPFETFLQKVLNLPEDWAVNGDYMTMLQALEADDAYGQKLDAYLAVCDAAGKEDTLYAPAASAYNQATSVLSTTDSETPDAASSAIYIYRQDPKRVVGTRVAEGPNFCPDLNAVLYALWVQSKNNENLVNVQGPEFNFSWEQLVLFLEYKMKILVDQGIGAPTILDANGLDPRDPAALRKAKALKIALTATGATKRGSDSSKSTAKRQKSNPSKTPSQPETQLTEEDVTFDQEFLDRKAVAYQCANYALHALSAGGFKDYSLGALVCKDQIQLMYYDHSCIAVSAPLDFRSDRRMYMLLQVCLYKTHQASVRNRGGIIGRLFLEPSPYMSDYAKYQEVVGTDFYNILSGQSITLEDANGPFLVKLGRIIDRQAGLIGRCTYIVNAESDRWPGMKLVVKITWSPEDRQSEATFVDRIREAAAAPEAQWVLDHVPNILHSQDFERQPDEVGGRLAAFLNDLATPYADTRFTYEKRILRVSVHEKLYKLSELGDVIDHAQVFFDVLQVHRWIYDHAYILHRDISLGNIMWHVRRDRICGVLNDFDLSSFRDNKSPSSKQRTGTRPFMAREFHVNPSLPPGHLYRHDLESIFYVLFILVTAHKLLEVPEHDAQADEKYYLQLDNRSQYSKWLQFTDYQLHTEKGNLLAASKPPAPNNTFSLLQDRIESLHDALYEGFHARAAHVKSVKVVRKQLRIPKSLRRDPAPSNAAPRLPPVKEVTAGVQTFDDSTLANHWTYAEFYKILSSNSDFEEMYPVACPDDVVPYVVSV